MLRPEIQKHNTFAVLHNYAVAYATSISVFVLLGQKCTMAESRAAPRRVTLNMRRALY